MAGAGDDAALADRGQGRLIAMETGPDVLECGAIGVIVFQRQVLAAANTRGQDYQGEVAIGAAGRGELGKAGVLHRMQAGEVGVDHIGVVAHAVFQRRI